MNVFERLIGISADPTSDVDVSEAKRRQTADGALLIDVREPDEWQSGHAPGARLIPLGSLPTRLADLPRDTEVLLICRSGNRSGQAQRRLRALGYSNAFNVAGGMIAWERAGLPVARG
jgi:rhodanese-related sulfurtransferase